MATSTIRCASSRFDSATYGFLSCKGGKRINEGNWYVTEDNTTLCGTKTVRFQKNGALIVCQITGTGTAYTASANGWQTLFSADTVSPSSRSLFMPGPGVHTFFLCNNSASTEPAQPVLCKIFYDSATDADSWKVQVYCYKNTKYNLVGDFFYFAQEYVKP